MWGSLFKSTGIQAIYFLLQKILLPAIFVKFYCSLNVLFQFQQRKYSSLTWFKCGKKGYGLKALEDISKGQFLIEYVGEVS